MAEPGKDTRYRVVLGVGVGALVLDQLTKLWVMASLPYYGAVTVIPGFFDLVNIRNRGAASGSSTGRTSNGSFGCSSRLRWFRRA